MIFTGILFYYTLWQVTLWWLFHIVTVFCGIKFPLRTRTFNALGHMKYIHIAFLIAGIFLPVIPVITTTSVAGFVSAPFPPIYCYSTSASAVFYSVTFPICIMDGSGITMIAIIVWLIVKVN